MNCRSCGGTQRTRTKRTLSRARFQGACGTLSISSQGDDGTNGGDDGTNGGDDGTQQPGGGFLSNLSTVQMLAIGAVAVGVAYYSFA